MIQNGPNGQTVQNGPEWSKTVQDDPKRSKRFKMVQMVQNGPEWSKQSKMVLTFQNGPEWSKTVQNGPKRSRMVQTV